MGLQGQSMWSVDHNPLQLQIEWWECKDLKGSGFKQNASVFLSELS